ncbi:MAG: CRISPR system precrRNA processing endoribonuclease RAMP protein Cas6 [Caldanaerobacter subterraneus]|nr:CRISPR system precrRNA processing endoribonuclease RAMP protein Cas6 [Caldanaerobacter subterraneus]
MKKYVEINNTGWEKCKEVIRIIDINIAKIEFELQAETKITLPVFKESALRGGFGQVLKKMVCIYSYDRPCYDCELAGTCPFSVIFSPSNPEEGFLKHHRGIPRPYIIRIPEKRNIFLPGEKLRIELTLIGKSIEYFPYIFLAFKELGKSGIGKKEEGKRGKFSINTVKSMGPDGRYEIIFDRNYENKVGRIMRFSLKEMLAPPLPEENTAKIFKLFFETPLRLKKHRRILDYPDFEAIIRSTVHRLNSFSYFYGNGKREKNISNLLEEARKVEVVSINTSFKQFSYYSHRQKSRLYLGGLVGQAVYRGNLKLFYPYLKAAELIGIGKNTAFGFGKVKVEAVKEGGIVSEK